MVSTTIPSKYATDINVLSKTLGVKMFTGTPEQFYKIPENQKQIAAQVQQAAKIRYSVAPPNQTVLPSKALNDTIKKVQDSGLKVTIPVPPAQPSSGKHSDGTPKTIVDIQPIIVQSPTPGQIINTYFTAAGQDFNRGIKTAEDYSKIAIIAAAIIGVAILFK